MNIRKLLRIAVHDGLDSDYLMNKLVNSTQLSLIKVKSIIYVHCWKLLILHDDSAYILFGGLKEHP